MSVLTEYGGQGIHAQVSPEQWCVLCCTVHSPSVVTQSVHSTNTSLGIPMPCLDRHSLSRGSLHTKVLSVITSSCAGLCAGVCYSYPTKKLHVTQKCLHCQVFESGLPLAISCTPCRTALVMYKWEYCLFLHVCIVIIQLEHVCQKNLNLCIVHCMYELRLCAIDQLCALINSRAEN